MSTKLSLVDWLASLPDTHDVKPLKVTIGGVTYEAAEYNQDRVADASCRKPGPYTFTAIYCIGKRPDTRKIAKRPESRSCFTMPNDQRDWYVAGHTADHLTPNPKFNPFGHSFILKAWDVDGKIDDHASKPYTRIPVQIG